MENRWSVKISKDPRRAARTSSDGPFRDSRSKPFGLRTCFAVLILCFLAVAAASPAKALVFDQSSPYLLIGLGPQNDTMIPPAGTNETIIGIGDATDTSSFELGANKAPVPAPSGFGPGLLNNVPNLPPTAQPVGTGITGHGNIAITSSDGVYSLSKVGIYADLGIQCTRTTASCEQSVSESFFNDPKDFPNTEFPQPAISKNEVTGDPLHAIAFPTAMGVTLGVDH